MPRRVMFNGKVQEFPDDATDDEIRGALEAGDSQPGPLKQPEGFSPSRMLGNVIPSAGSYLKSTVQALTSPRETLSNLAGAVEGGLNRGASALAGAVGLPNQLTPEEESQGQKFDAVVNNYKQRYGSVPQALKTLETDPVGVAADASMLAGGAGAALKAGGLNKAASAANAVSQAANPLVGVPRAAAKMVPNKLKDAAAVRLYESALKPPRGTFDMSEVEAMVNKGLDEKIALSGMMPGKALDKTRGKIDAINDTVNKTIEEGNNAGKAVDPVKVAGYTDRSIERFTTVDPADKAPIIATRDRFLDKHSDKYPYTKIRPAVDDATGFVPVGEGVATYPRPIPVKDAQRLKQNTYRELRDSAFGEQVGAAREAKKDLARGLKEGVYDHFPQLREMGKAEKSLIDLENAIEMFATRYRNRDVVGLGGPAKVLTGSAMGGVVGQGVGLLGAMLEMPAIKTRIAIALRSAARGQRGPARGRQAMNAATRIQPPTEMR